MSPRVRVRYRARPQFAIQLLGIAFALGLLSYFAAYSTLHVKVADSKGIVSVEYWSGLSRLPDQRFWRTFFGMAHAFDQVVWSDAWVSTPRKDEVDNSAGTGSKGGSQARMVSESIPLDTMPADVSFPTSLILDGGVLPAAAPGPVQIDPR